MPNNIKPPVSTLGTPFTKLLKVSLENTGTISVSSIALAGGMWTTRETKTGTLQNGNTSFEMGVPPGGRAILNIDAEIWTNDWFGSSQQLVGKHPANIPFVFGEANYTGGQAGIFAAPGLIHTLSKVPGQIALKLVTVPAEPGANNALQPLADRSMATLIKDATPKVALVLWLEANQTGYVKFTNLPGLNQAVDMNL
jgi:hypothetical protein